MSKFLSQMAGLSKKPSDFKRAGAEPFANTSGDTQTGDVLRPDALQTMPEESIFRMKRGPAAWFEAQDAHTVSEEIIYKLLYKHGIPYDKVSRKACLSIAFIAGQVHLADRNIQKRLVKLVEKKAIELLAPEDKGKKIPKVWRVFDYSEINRRRREAGLTHVIRTRNLVALTQAPALESVVTVSGDTLTGDDFLKSKTSGDNLTKMSGDKLSSHPYIIKSLIKTTTTTEQEVVAVDLPESTKIAAGYFPDVGADLMQRIWGSAQAIHSTITDPELAGVLTRTFKTEQKSPGLWLTLVPSYLQNLRGDFSKLRCPLCAAGYAFECGGDRYHLVSGSRRECEEWRNNRSSGAGN